MSVNKLDNNVMNQAHLVDSYARTRPSRGDGVASPKDTGNHLPAPAGGSADTADISENAVKMAELRQMVDAGRAAMDAEPEVRADRVALAKERLASGFYQSAEVRDKVAARISGMILEGGLF